MIALLLALATPPTPTPIPTPRNPPVARELAQGEKPISSGLGDIAKNRKLKANTFTVEPSDAISALDSFTWGTGVPASFKRASDRSGLEWFYATSGDIFETSWGGMKAVLQYGYEEGRLVAVFVMPIENCGTLRARLEKRWGPAIMAKGGPGWLETKSFATIKSDDNGCGLTIMSRAYAERVNANR